MPDVHQPEHWPGQGLDLLADGQLLASFPPTVGPREAFGLIDAYTYDRSPGSSVFFALGDGLPSGVPTLSASGSWTYQSIEEALSVTAEQERALLTADQVNWRGLPLAQLRTDSRGGLLIASGERFTQMSYTLTLNLTERLTRAKLAEAQL